MKYRSVLVLAVLAFTTFSATAAQKWLEDLAPAQKQAAAEKKVILVDFTGSTWCPPCIQLHKEVFSTKLFQDYAAKNLVLMKVDLPDPVSQPTGSTEELIKRYIPGDLQLPTIVIVAADGKSLGVVPYQFDKAEAFIKKVEKIAKK